VIVPELVADWNRIHTFSKAFLALEADAHYAIGLLQYTRATSPIRRYTDVLTHFQIKAHLMGREPPFTQEMLTPILPHLDQKEKEVKQLSKQSEKFWMHRYFQQVSQLQIITYWIAVHRFLV
jgi:exoribonuclease-2